MTIGAAVWLVCGRSATFVGSPVRACLDWRRHPASIANIVGDSTGATGLPVSAGLSPIQVSAAVITADTGRIVEDGAVICVVTVTGVAWETAGSVCSTEGPLTVVAGGGAAAC